MHSYSIIPFIQLFEISSSDPENETPGREETIIYVASKYEPSKEGISLQ
jgi:hypothetical protein